MCNCINLVNDNLEKQTDNTKLDIPIVFNQATNELKADMACVATTKRDDHSRKRAARLFAAYCPFCGEKYPDAKDESNVPE